MVMCSIFDRVSGSYQPISCYVNEDVAKRGVAYTFSNDPFLSSHTGDYDLVVFGDFDDRKGVISCYDRPSVIPVDSILSKREE